MGLDGVELLLEVEEQFGIKVSDDAATQMRTVGDLYWYIVGRSDSGSKFYRADDAREKMVERVRTAISDTWNIDRKMITGESRLQSLWPRRKRGSSWERLSDRLGCHLPRTHYRSWIGSAMLATLLIAIIWTVCGMVYVVGWGRWSAVIPWSLLVLMIVTLRWWGRSWWCLEISERIGTVTRLAAWLEDGDSINGVWLRLQGIVAEQCGKKADEIRMESRFVEDLGF